jgi:hypothetical protein
MIRNEIYNHIFNYGNGIRKNYNSKREPFININSVYKCHRITPVSKTPRVLLSLVSKVPIDILAQNLDIEQFP